MVLLNSLCRVECQGRVLLDLIFFNLQAFLPEVIQSRILPPVLVSLDPSLLDQVFLLRHLLREHHIQEATEQVSP